MKLHITRRAFIGDFSQINIRLKKNNIIAEAHPKEKNPE